MNRVWQLLTLYSLLLIIGALIALVWANVEYQSYEDFVAFKVWNHAPIGHLHPANDTHGAYRTLTLHFLVNDLMMALFFAIAAKKVWEAAVLKNGALKGKKR